MNRLIVPPLEEEPWPTLGPEVCDFIEERRCHGPGDVLGDPIVLSDEVRFILYRTYEVYPKGHQQEGRRRFKRAGLSRAKGWSKTEFAALVASTEADPEAPVRCDGFRRDGKIWVPVGRPVSDPYIPMVAYTEEQVEDLAYAAVYEILAHSDPDNWDLGLDRITHRKAPGKITAVAGAPDARDGARTSFQSFDEVQRLDTPRLRNAHATMLRNIPKRYAADPWSLETGTVYAPGSLSVAEFTHQYAESIAGGQHDDPRLFFDHRQAADHWRLDDPDELRAAIVEARGDHGSWADVESIAALWDDPQQPAWDLERFWLNRPRGSGNRWIDSQAWAAKSRDDSVPAPDTEIVLAFWGGRSRRSAGLVGCTRDQHLFVVDYWEPVAAGMRVTQSEVDAAIARAFDRWTVREFVNSREGGSGWQSEIDGWVTEYGEPPVIGFPINSPARMGPACERFHSDVHDGPLTHDGHPALTRHVAVAVPTDSRFGVWIRSPADQPVDLARAGVMAVERAAHIVDLPAPSEPLTPFFAVT